MDVSFLKRAFSHARFLCTIFLYLEHYVNILLLLLYLLLFGLHKFQRISITGEAGGDSGAGVLALCPADDAAAVDGEGADEE